MANAPYPTDGGGMPSCPTYESTMNEATGVNQFTASTFSDKDVRRKFIRKVYFILAIQLTVTTAIVCIFTFVPEVRYAIQRNPWAYYVAYAVFLITYIILSCCVECRRRSPGNYLCLAVFTLALSYLAGTMAAFHSTLSVMIAFLMTIILCVAITLFAMQTRWDFTMCSGLILALSLTLLLTGMACLIVNFTLGRNNVLSAVYSGVALLLFSILLVVDTQMVLGGKGHELSEEEYIFGALQIYVDVVIILISIMGISGAAR
ncbi:hypothetical protein CRM22_005170 [Opisthorchis felineus]|uniref:Uncharacterized protein n=1 Tax=Opisthorchis felineus TaxID=147828 RepID=A0A4S2LSK5_OPIFE|nr:hypothetical protein CRM22_005170 [Opisthorchis felineus]